MCHFGKVETDVHINASAEKFHELYSSRPHHIGNVSSVIDSVEMHQGEWGKVGSILVWNFVQAASSCFGIQVSAGADDRVRRLLDFATLLPLLEESDRVVENHVRGCMTQVCLMAEMDEFGRMRFKVDSDSEISKGLYGKACVAKAVIEAIDPAKKLITFKVIEGDVLDHYKSFKATIQVSPKEKGSVIHWTYEYEKLHGAIPNPHTLMEIVATMSREIDAHLTEGEGHEEQLVGKIEVDVHINVSAEKFHEIFSSKPHEVPNISPNNIKNTIVEGEWGKEGSIFVVHYVHEHQNDISSYSKDKGSLVHVTVEYEKLKGHIPDPHSLADLGVEVAKDIDTHLTQ
ncbi:MLP-like protein 28 [Senna tora]|uniref:MLP-like protein 28 n=1 Tax=Senna tora TaxID=362788 RepID=A0A834WLM0_9FABA|nr:MLP-like protein 28 [Senna tora]